MKFKHILVTLLFVMVLTGCGAKDNPSGADPALQESQVEELNNNGFTALNQGDLETAHDYFDRAILADSKNARAYLGKAQTYLNAREIEKSIELTKKIIELDTYYVDEALNTMGNGYMALNQLELAEESFLQAISKNPDYPSPYWNLGILYREFGRYQEALDAWEQAIALARSLPGSNLLMYLQHRAETYTDILYEYELAIADYTEIIEIHKELDSDPAPFLAARALAYESLGQLERSIADIDEALTYHPGNTDLLEYREMLVRSRR